MSDVVFTDTDVEWAVGQDVGFAWQIIILGGRRIFSFDNERRVLGFGNERKKFLFDNERRILTWQL